MTQTLAVELGRAGIRVNAIAPGLVDTRFAATLIHNEEASKYMNERAALGRHAQPEEIAPLVVFLAQRRGVVRDRADLRHRRRLPHGLILPVNLTQPAWRTGHALR